MIIPFPISQPARLSPGEINAIYAQMLADGMQFYPGKLTPPMITIEEWRDRELARVAE